MPTVHNPTNFEPSDYTVLDYFDNQPPRFTRRPDSASALDTETLLLELEDILGLEHTVVKPTTEVDELGKWRAQRDELFPDGANKCAHCGNTNVRFVVSCLHRPTNRRVCFGDICVDRLSFTNRNEFTAAQMRKKATAMAASLKVWRLCDEFLGEHPELVAALREAKHEIHANNAFIKDVLAKFYKYGSLSPRQLECVTQSLARDSARAAVIAARPVPTAPAPEGRVQVVGQIVSLKQVNSYGFSSVTKMLVVLDTGAKVWCSTPGLTAFERHDRITFKATFKRSEKDQYFAFGKRPHLINVVSARDAKEIQGDLAARVQEITAGE